MKKLLIALLTTTSLLTACQMSDPAAPHPSTGDGSDSSAVYQKMAYEEMFNGSLTKAETYAYRAFMLSRDSMLAGDALSLLGYIYYREGRQEELQLLMQTITPEMYMNVMDVQLQVEQAKAGRQQQMYVAAIVVLLLLLGALGFGYVRRTRALARLCQAKVGD